MEEKTFLYREEIIRQLNLQTTITAQEKKWLQDYIDGIIKASQVEARVIRKTPEAEEEKTITFNFDETVDGEAAIFALYAGLRMYKEIKDKQPKEAGKFSIPAAEAYCMLEQIKEQFPNDYIECMIEYDKIYGER